MLIKTRPSAYFFSESIIMLPGTSKDVSLSELTDSQVRDIYEGTLTGRLIVDSQESLESELEKRAAKSGSSSTTSSDLESKIKALEESIKNTAKNIPSSQEVEELLRKLREAVPSSTTIEVPNFVAVFKANLN